MSWTTSTAGTKAGGSKAWARRHNARFPFRNRWLIVKARSRSTWHEVWYDLVYLVRG